LSRWGSNAPDDFSEPNVVRSHPSLGREKNLDLILRSIA